MLMKRNTLRNIQTVNMPDLDRIELARIKSAIEGCYDKLSKILNTETFLKIHFKQHHTTGQRQKHSVSMKLGFSGKTMFSNESGWQLHTTVQKACSYLERETIKAIETSG